METLVSGEAGSAVRKTALQRNHPGIGEEGGRRQRFGLPTVSMYQT